MTSVHPGSRQTSISIVGSGGGGVGGVGGGGGGADLTTIPEEPILSDDWRRPMTEIPLIRASETINSEARIIDLLVIYEPATDVNS
jgi:hypothetical protein